MWGKVSDYMTVDRSGFSVEWSWLEMELCILSLKMVLKGLKLVVFTKGKYVDRWPMRLRIAQCHPNILRGLPEP